MRHTHSPPTECHVHSFRESDELSKELAGAAHYVRSSHYFIVHLAGHALGRVAGAGAHLAPSITDTSERRRGSAAPPVSLSYRRQVCLLPLPGRSCSWRSELTPTPFFKAIPAPTAAPVGTGTGTGSARAVICTPKPIRSRRDVRARDTYCSRARHR